MTTVTDTASRDRRRRFRSLTVLGALLSATVVATILARHVPNLGRMPHPGGWLLAVTTVAIAASYVSAAVGLRAAAGLPLPLGRTVLAQLAAALANRVTPAGLGGAAVNTRYLIRQGAQPPAAAAAVAAVALANSLATACFGLVFIPFAASPRLLSHLGPLVLVGAPVAVVLLAVATLARHRLSATARRWATTALTTVTALRRDPIRLATVIIGSLGVKATHVLALLCALGAVDSDMHAGVVIGVYVVGSAIGSAVPTPNGLGTTDAALVTGLVAAGGSITTVVAGVMIFRLASFWLPIVPGAVATWGLRRRHAL